MTEDIPFITPKTFSLTIEQVVAATGESYMDAIIAYCEEQNLEIEDVGKLINKSLYSKLENEAGEKNLLKEKKSKAKLPI